MFRWLVTDTHICRLLLDENDENDKKKEKENEKEKEKIEKAKVRELPEGSRIEAMVVGDGHCVWLGGRQSFSCWK